MTITELSEAERFALQAACGFVRNRNVETVVESIIAARVADAVAPLLAEARGLHQLAQHLARRKTE